MRVSAAHPQGRRLHQRPGCGWGTGKVSQLSGCRADGAIGARSTCQAGPCTWLPAGSAQAAGPASTMCRAEGAQQQRRCAEEAEAHHVGLPAMPHAPVGWAGRHRRCRRSGCQRRRRRPAVDGWGRRCWRACRHLPAHLLLCLPGLQRLVVVVAALDRLLLRVARVAVQRRCGQGGLRACARAQVSTAQALACSPPGQAQAQAQARLVSSTHLPSVRQSP